MFDLSGKAALVTGASGGIGGAIARALHKQGATVTLSGTRADALETLGLESLDVLELTFAIEEKFNIEIPFNANTEFDFKTVGELVHAVEGLVAKKTASA